MCLAIFKPAGKSIPFDHIKTAWITNKDGAGVAIRRNSGDVEISKGFMYLTDFMTFLANNEEYLNERDVVIHLRYSTCSEIVPEMTHPFPVTKKTSDLKLLDTTTKMALIHNGILFSPKFKNFSDTAILARWLGLKKRTNKQIMKVIGTNNKLAIVTSKKVELLGEWHDLDGIMYSNLYSIQKWNDKPSFLDKKYASFDLEFCPLCGSDDTRFIGINTDTCECLECHTVYNEEFMLEGKIVSTKTMSYNEDEFYLNADYSLLKKAGY